MVLHRPIGRVILPTRSFTASPLRFYRTSQPHYFINNRQLLLVLSRTRPRPQLHFLHPSQNGPLQGMRLMSTERRNFWWTFTRLFVKWVVIIEVFLFCIKLIRMGLQEERTERAHPTPHEFTWYPTRTCMREAWRQEDPELHFLRVTDWIKSHDRWTDCEFFIEHHDFEGVVKLEKGDVVASWLDNSGYDLTMKSEPWRRGYFEILMGCVRSSINQEGWLREEGTWLCFPGDQVVSPSNPNRKPWPDNKRPPPREEDCHVIPWWKPPETYYTKILNSKGFSNDQKLTAALSYGDYLDDKKEHDKAGEMYAWALQIASNGLDDPSLFDAKRAIIKDPSAATPNIVKATTSVATHFAKLHDFPAALSSYLSVLRAHRIAPHVPSTPSIRPLNWPQWIGGLISPPPYPPPPPSGDLPFTVTPDDASQEAILLAYIGEVLFAGRQKDAGLSFTRDSIALAERIAKDTSLKRNSQRLGIECAQMGLRNLKKMLEQVAEDDVSRAERRQTSWFRIPQWLWGGEPEEDIDSKMERWTKELQTLDDRWEEWKSEELHRMLWDRRDANPMTKIFYGLLRHG